jgi:osmoprotectant transport system permease protein
VAAPHPRYVLDPVALTGAVTALVSCLALPLAQLRSSRLALAGEPHRALEAGPFGVAAVALALAAVAVALVGRPALRRLLAQLDATALAVALAWAFGAAVTRLAAQAPPIARVSPGVGFWVALAGAAALAFAGRDAAPASRPWRSLALGAVALAGFAAAAAYGGLAQVSIGREYAVRSDVFWQLAAQHLALAGAGLAGGVLIGVPLGIAATRRPRLRALALGVTGILETVPSLALLGLLIAPLAALAAAYPSLEAAGVGGIGPAPALIALVTYALLPVVRGTYVALDSVDFALVDAGRGMGMSRVQLFARVELPLALPLVIEGVRVAAVLLIGITTVTAFVGEGGFGALIFQGVGQNAPDLILLGALPVIVLAVVADYGLRAVASLATPRGVGAA